VPQDNVVATTERRLVPPVSLSQKDSRQTQKRLVLHAILPAPRQQVCMLSLAVFVHLIV